MADARQVHRALADLADAAEEHETAVEQAKAKRARVRDLAFAARDGGATDDELASVLNMTPADVTDWLDRSR